MTIVVTHTGLLAIGIGAFVGLLIGYCVFFWRRQRAISSFEQDSESLPVSTLPVAASKLPVGYTTTEIPF